MNYKGQIGDPIIAIAMLSEQQYEWAGTPYVIFGHPAPKIQLLLRNDRNIVQNIDNILCLKGFWCVLMNFGNDSCINLFAAERNQHPLAHLHKIHQIIGNFISESPATLRSALGRMQSHP